MYNVLSTIISYRCKYVPVSDFISAFIPGELMFTYISGICVIGVNGIDALPNVKICIPSGPVRG